MLCHSNAQKSEIFVVYIHESSTGPEKWHTCWNFLKDVSGGDTQQPFGMEPGDDLSEGSEYLIYSIVS